MRQFLIAVAAVGICLAAPSKVSRAQLKVLEASFDKRISHANIDDPYDLLGSTRAVYIDGFGVVFSNEVNLVIGPAITPFRPKLNADEVEKLRHRKFARLPQLRQLIRDFMVTSATQLKSMPAEEQVVFGWTGHRVLSARGRGLSTGRLAAWARIGSVGGLPPRPHRMVLTGMAS